MSGYNIEVQRAQESYLPAVLRLAQNGPAGGWRPIHCHPPVVDSRLLNGLRIYPDGAVIASAGKPGVVGYAQTIRKTKARALAPTTPQKRQLDEGRALHDVGGDWLCVTQLILAAPPGPAGDLHVLPALLQGLEDMNAAQDISGLAVALPFPGRRDRSGETAYQRACFEDGSAPTLLMAAYHDGFTHHAGLPHAYSESRHGSLMIRRCSGE